MINEEKVKLMTKLAIYESQKGKKQLNISKYYKRDYVRYNMFKTVVAATVSFIMLLAIYVLVNAEDLLMSLNELDFMKEATKLGILYVVFILIYMIVARIIYARRYEQVKPDVIMYNHNLKKLKGMYDKEEKELDEKRAGRSVKLVNDNLDQY